MLGLLTAIASVLGFLLLITVIHFLRRRKVRTIDLRPNCLMTRSPLVFITGHRSLFYFINYWNTIPDFLVEHGYEVQVWNLPWRNFDKQFNHLQKRLATSSGQVHLFSDSSNSKLIDRALLTNRAKIVSVSVAKDIGVSTRKIRSWRDLVLVIAFYLHRRLYGGQEARVATELAVFDDCFSFKLESLYLDRAISLAEDELQ